MSAEQEHHHPGGGHYSGLNRIPNIKEFAASLDRDKRERDARIDDELKKNTRNGGIKEHQAEKGHLAGHGRVVTDPVTGKEVQIDDETTDFRKAVEDPHVGYLLTSIQLPLLTPGFHSYLYRTRIWAKRRPSRLRPTSPERSIA
jgi:hypothetical protein